MVNVSERLTPQEIFNNKKLFSDKIHARVQKDNREISKALDNLKIGNDEDKRLFLNAVNHYYNELCAVIFHLRQVVIKIDCNDQGVRDLQKVISELNKIVVLVQDFLNVETGKLIIQLKGTVVHVGSQVEKLMEVLKYDSLHEHKQKILDTQHDLAIAMEALKLYCLFCYIDIPEMVKMLHEIIDTILKNLSQITTGHEHMTEDFLHYTRHSVWISQNTVNYMRKLIYTEEFPNVLANSFKTVYELSLAFFSEFTAAANSDNPMVNMLEVFRKKKKMFSESAEHVQRGLQAVAENNISKKETERQNQLIIYLFVNRFKALSAVNQSIVNAIMKE